MVNENTQSWTYFGLMRGVIRAEEYIPAALLIEEVKQQNITGTEEELYSSMLMFANKKGIKNPFPDVNTFYRLYKASPEKLNWEIELERELKSNRYTVLADALIQKFEEHLSVNPDTVLIAEAENFVPQLQKIVDEYINTRFTLTTHNINFANIFQHIFAEYENVEVVVTNIYEYGFIDKRYDLIFSVPAFGGRTLAEDSSFICREYDAVALENLSYHLNSGGELIIIVPARVTYASGRTADLRRFIQTNYTIKELAALPEGVFENSGIRTYFLNLINCRPGDEDIVIRKYSSKGRKNKRSIIDELIIEEDTFVMLDEIEQQGDWNVDHIFSQQDEEWLKYQNSGIRKDLLGNVAQVFRGKSVTQKEPNGSIGVVNISNIGDYEIDYDNLDHINEEERKISNYILQEGDVLLPARGTAIRTAVFHKQSYPCIAHSNVIVIRPDEKNLDGTFLKIFLDSPLGNKMISGAQQGMVVMNISYRDLQALEIPVPNIDEQKKRAEEYNTELTQYKDSLAVAEKRWKSTVAKLQKF